MQKIKYETHEMDIVSAIETGIGDLRDDLGAEIREIVDNASEGLSQTSRIQTLSETADTLENISDPTFPDWMDDVFKDVKVEYSIGKKSSKKSPYPRWLRRDNGVAPIQAAFDKLEDWADNQEQELGDGKKADEANKEEVESLSEGARRLVEDQRKIAQGRIDEIRSLIDELDNIIIEAEGCEFPGMYG